MPSGIFSRAAQSLRDIQAVISPRRRVLPVGRACLPVGRGPGRHGLVGGVPSGGTTLDVVHAERRAADHSANSGSFFPGVNYFTLLDRSLNYLSSVGGWAVLNSLRIG